MMNDNSKFSSSDEARLLDQLYRVAVERHVFDNGLTLVHRPDFSSEAVSVQVWVRTGSIHEGDLMGSGLSHYLEHMLFKGTERRDAKSISREVHALGASINAYTTFDRTVYYVDTPVDGFGAAVDVLADIVFESVVSEVEVNRERDVILREIDMGMDDPDRRMMQGVFQTAFQRHPYREPVIGHRALFEQVTREELWTYYKARYVPNNMVVAVVGAVTAEACRELIGERFGGYPRKRLAPVLVSAEPEQLAPRHFRMTGDYKVFRGALAFKVPHLSHPDSPRLDALAHALGGGESALLWQRLRNELKLVHYIDCRNWSPGERGLFWISYVCDADKSGEVEVALRDVLESVRVERLPDTVIGKARRQALSAEINGRKTVGGQASRLGLAEVVLGDLNYGRRYLRRLSEADSEQLREVAAAYLVEPGAAAVSLGPDREEKRGVLSDIRAARPPGFEKQALRGGARLLLQPDRSLPKAHLRCLFLGGPAFEPEGKRGISAILAEMLTKDTAKRSAQEVSDQIEAVGGSFAASAGNNTLNLAIEVLPVDLDLALELLEEALTRPAFREDTLHTELAAQISYLQERDDEILEYGFRRLREEFFGKHPLAVDADGRIEDVEGISAQDLREHFDRLVRGENLVVAVAGDFDRGRVVSRLGGLLEKGVSTQPFRRPERMAGEDTRESREVSERLKREQAVVLQGYPDVGILHEDHIVGDVLNELLSGMSSRLFERIREDRGMAYYVGSTRVLGLHESLFVLYAGTHPEQAAEVSKEMDGELARIAAGDVLEMELERCRTRLKAARILGRQTIGSRAMHAGLEELYGLPVEDEAAYAARLEGVDAGRLAAFVRSKIRPDRRVLLRVGP